MKCLSKHLILALVFLLSCQAEIKKNDLAEWGYKGKVKSVQTISMFNSDDDPSAYRSVVSVETKYFNQDGNIDSITYGSGPEGTEALRTVRISFENGLKASGKRTLANGDSDGTLEFKWIDDKQYEMFDRDAEGEIKMWTRSELNDDYRDWKGESKYYLSGKEERWEIYENELGDDGEILSTLFTNQETGEEYKNEYTDKFRDDVGNMTKLKVVSGLNDGYVRRVVREFEYYD